MEYFWICLNFGFLSFFYFFRIGEGHCKALRGTNSNDKRSHNHRWVKYKRGLRSSHAGCWSMTFNSAPSHKTRQSPLSEKQIAVLFVRAEQSLWGCGSKKDRRLAAGARINPKCWRLDATSWAKWLSSGRRPDYGVFSLPAFAAVTWKLSAMMRQTLGMPRATASKRRKKKKSALWWAANAARIRCYKDKNNAVESMIWNVLNLITYGARTAFSSYRWNAKRARHKRNPPFFRGVCPH